MATKEQVEAVVLKTMLRGIMTQVDSIDGLVDAYGLDWQDLEKVEEMIQGHVKKLLDRLFEIEPGATKIYKEV